MTESDVGLALKDGVGQFDSFLPLDRLIGLRYLLDGWRESV